MQSWDRLAWGGSLVEMKLRAFCTSAAAPFLPCQGHEHAMSLRRPCLGYDGCCVLFQSSMEELGRGAHSPAGKFLQCCIDSSPHMSSVRQGGLMLTWECLLPLAGCAGLPAICLMVHVFLFSHLSELTPLVPQLSSPTAQLLCYRLGPPPDSWKMLGGVGNSPSTGPRTAGPKTPLG